MYLRICVAALCLVNLHAAIAFPLSKASSNAALEHQAEERNAETESRPVPDDLRDRVGWRHWVKTFDMNLPLGRRNKIKEYLPMIADYEKSTLEEAGAPVDFVMSHDHSDSVNVMRQWASSTPEGREWCESTKTDLVAALKELKINIDATNMRAPCPPPGSP